MTTITINKRTKKGKILLEYLRKFEGEDFITFEDIPNASTLKAMEDARTGSKTKEMGNIKDYFDEIHKHAKD